MSRIGGMVRTTRPKKLSPKQPIPIFREGQIDLIEDDTQAALQAVQTGVEKDEESEFHLQAAINAAAHGKVSEAHIPTPDTVVSGIQYDKLYTYVFQQPVTYIRFSSTVEDCSGCSYNLTLEDDIARRRLNQNRNASTQCSEDQFEEVMNFFEETAQTSQPFAAVDHPPVISYSEMEQSFDGLVDERTRRFAPEIYEHWKSRRTNSGNRPLAPSLKFETGQDTDDSDPYVCFRRRELRQARKTRGRDAQSSEKLKRLRKELEDARHLLSLVRQREASRKDMLITERQLFVQRAEVKEMKRKLGIKDDDEDLINQKVNIPDLRQEVSLLMFLQPKKKPPEVPVLHRPAAPQHAVPSRPVGPGEDLQLLDDVQSEKENEIMREIKQSVAKHIRWNEGYVDLTMAPLTPVSDQEFDTGFRPAITTFLPTPPASDSSDHPPDSTSHHNHISFAHDRLSIIRQSPPPEEEPVRRMPSFRRRIGRGGRILIDRRNIPPRRRTTEVDPIKLERFKYDRDDDDSDGVIEYDPDDIQIMQHRAYLTTKARDHQLVQAQIQAQNAKRLQNESTSHAPTQQYSNPMVRMSR